MELVSKETIVEILNSYGIDSLNNKNWKIEIIVFLKKFLIEKSINFNRFLYKY